MMRVCNAGMASLVAKRQISVTSSCTKEIAFLYCV
jgi:hypothetical protein